MEENSLKGYLTPEESGKLIASFKRNSHMKQISTPIHVNIEKYVLKEIDSARKSIHISMAWLTAKKIQQALLEKKMRQTKVVIEIVVDPNPTNVKYFYNNAAQLRALGIIIHEKVSRKFLHVKKMIIDGERVMEGSYNFTDNAKNNLEAAVLTKNKEYASYHLRIFRTYTQADYIDINIDLLCHNPLFAQGIVSAYYPFTKKQYQEYRKKIAPGECFTAPNGLYDQLHYEPGFIFNPVCKPNPRNGFSEFDIPITREWLEQWHVMRSSHILYQSYRDIYGGNNGFWRAFSNDMKHNMKTIEAYFTEKLRHIYSAPVLQEKIDQQIDVIMESTLWDLNFMPFITKHAFQSVMAALPEVAIKEHWPIENNVLQRK
jgi:hypothetical protein